MTFATKKSVFSLQRRPNLCVRIFRSMLVDGTSWIRVNFLFQLMTFISHPQENLCNSCDRNVRKQLGLYDCRPSYRSKYGLWNSQSQKKTNSVILIILQAYSASPWTNKQSTFTSGFIIHRKTEALRVIFDKSCALKRLPHSPITTVELLFNLRMAASDGWKTG